jgi:hypothetical protein
VVNLMGRTSIGDLAGVLHNMDLLITTDTGTMHLAAAVGTKILALFIGPALCHETGPYGAGHVILQTTTPCSPCTEGEAGCSDHWCRRLIGVEAAARLAGWIIDGRPGRPDVDPGPQVQALVSEFDSWGVTCQPLAAPKMTRTELMALAYREAGRRYIRPGYRPDAEVAAREAAERGLADDFCLSELAGRLADIGADPGRVPSLIDDEDLAPLARLLKSAAADRPEAAGRLAADIRRVVDGAAAPHAPENVPDRADSGTELATYIGLRVRS